ESEHVRECPECRAEVERFGKALSLFRSVVSDLADDRVVLQASNVTTFIPAPAPIPKWRWALVVAGFVAVFVIPFFTPTSKPPEPVEPVSAEMSPEAVMERLNRHLSRTAPAPMEPVMALIPSEELARKPGR